MPPPGGHVVLAAADSAPYASLRRRPTSRAERYALGKALRTAGAALVARRLGGPAPTGRTRSS